jgi:sugar phosphate isomerase/epimerase
MSNEGLPPRTHCFGYQDFQSGYLPKAPGFYRAQIYFHQNPDGAINSNDCKGLQPHFYNAETDYICTRKLRTTAMTTLRWRVIAQQCERGAVFTRRSIAAVSLGGLAFSVMQARALGGTERSFAQRSGVATLAGVNIGCSTYTFAPAHLDQAVRSIADAGFTSSELHPSQIEPSFVMQPTFPTASFRVDRQSERNFARASLRQWRLGVPLEHFAATGQRFRDAGIKLVAYNANYGGDVTDAEIDRSFEMTKALGTDLITAVGPVRTLRRLDPFARSHKMAVAFHNEEEIPNVHVFEEAVEGMSEYIGFNLDIGHFTSTGGDSLAMLKKHSGRIWDIHLKDQRKNFGPVVPFGQGDSPIGEVLRRVRDTHFTAPINIEQEAPGWDREAIAKQALEYCRKVLTT